MGQSGCYQCSVERPDAADTEKSESIASVCDLDDGGEELERHCVVADGCAHFGQHTSAHCTAAALPAAGTLRLDHSRVADEALVHTGLTKMPPPNWTECAYTSTKKGTSIVHLYSLFQFTRKHRQIFCRGTAP
jgi:hypothetical protein